MLTAQNSPIPTNYEPESVNENLNFLNVDYACVSIMVIWLRTFLARDNTIEVISIIENSAPNKSQNASSLPVDLIRTVAIIMVIMYHATTEPYDVLHITFTQYFVQWWSSTIYESLVIMGVPLFVMLSGALLLQPSKVNEPIKVFLKKASQPNRASFRVLECNLLHMELLRQPYSAYF